MDLEQILANPLNYAFGGDGRTVDWAERRRPSEFFLGDIYIKYLEINVAYIQNTTIYPNDNIANINHFATEAGWERKGLGTAIAKGLFTKLNEEYEVNRIIFSENSTKYHEFYPSFFRSFGAYEVNFQNRQTPDWHWDFADCV